MHVMLKDLNVLRPSAAALLQHAWVAGKDSIENVDPSSQSPRTASKMVQCNLVVSRNTDATRGSWPYY